MEKLNVAFVTDDGTTISQHFGRAKFFEVLFIENGVVKKREQREKLGHHSFANNEQHHHSAEHGMDEGSHNKHASMVEAIKDCDIIVARGMGYGAYNSLAQLNIKTIITDIKNIDDTIIPLSEGTIDNHLEKLH